MADLAVMHGHNMIRDVRMTTRWSGKFVGKQIYEYTLDAPEEKYIAMTGIDVDVYFTIPSEYRLVAVKLKQVTAAGVDSNAPISYELFERYPETNEYGSIEADAGNYMYWVGRQGVTWESSAVDLMFRMNGVNTNLVYPVITLQYVKFGRALNR